MKEKKEKRGKDGGGGRKEEREITQDGQHCRFLFTFLISHDHLDSAEFQPNRGKKIKTLEKALLKIPSPDADYRSDD